MGVSQYFPFFPFRIVDFEPRNASPTNSPVRAQKNSFILEKHGILRGIP